MGYAQNEVWTAPLPQQQMASFHVQLIRAKSLSQLCRFPLAGTKNTNDPMPSVACRLFDRGGKALRDFPVLARYALLVCRSSP